MDPKAPGKMDLAFAHAIHSHLLSSRLGECAMWEHRRRRRLHGVWGGEGGLHGKTDGGRGGAVRLAGPWTVAPRADGPWAMVR